ncbi:unnamed protein product [Sphenostylis stenocarpa]|uniref:Oxysterol-binding protein n=1 Tax=Sphenostylis stenocarpa TaxID=92480 RepID=A0AA86S033_9FABA|nr:unnamed protein product [Sphenostylis stenocarpa]
MQVKEMHPLCCISLESPGIGNHSPEPEAAVLYRTRSLPVVGSLGNAARGSETTVAGVLYKWTNYGKGWRSRWFLLRNGVLSYAKIRCPENLNLLTPFDDVRLIGEISSNRLARVDGSSAVTRRKHRKASPSSRVVHLKSSSGIQTILLYDNIDIVHWFRGPKPGGPALVLTRGLDAHQPLNDHLLLAPNDIYVSTERLKSRLLEEGTCENLVKECEQIMLSEFSEMQGQLEVLCLERSNLLDTISQLEAANTEPEATALHDGEYQLTNNEFSSLGRGKYSECSTTESSDDIEKQEMEEASDEDEISYYDTRECFTEPDCKCESEGAINQVKSCWEANRQCTDTENIHPEKMVCNYKHSQIARRKKLPDPVEKEKGVSLWSMIKDNVGKDLTRVCLPVYFNEPISSLQKCCEDLEYSYLLDQAYECGKSGNGLLRALYVAAFAVSGYASSEGRNCKPFNPLLGETYEADFPEKGIRFFSEKVSHHPTLIACHCEGRGWKFWADSNIHSKFWGRSIQLDPVGVLTLEFNDGEIFQWSKVTTTIYNLILGKIYCDHHGNMDIRGNRKYSCRLKFKEQTILDRNPRQVHGYVEDVTGKKVATLFGKWDDSMYYMSGNVNVKPKDFSSPNACLLWKRSMPSPNLTRYNLTPFAITLNELTPGLKEKLPPTDSRLRPDQRHLENGEYDKANLEKQRLEKRQRMSRKIQEKGWKPRWFRREGENGTFRYIGGYWEARELGSWDGCPDIFGEFNEESADPIE